MAEGTSESDVPVLFLHGFKGSVLADDEGSVRWLTLRQALFSPPKVQLPLTWNEAGEQDRDDLHPVCPLSAVGGFHKVYEPLLSMGRRGGLGRPFSSFCWDWRRDVSEAVPGLLAALREFTRPPQILAHSMGGVVTWMALQQLGREASKVVHSVVFCGTPFGPVTILADMTRGTKQHSAMLDYRTLFTFPSPLVLFPGGEWERAQYWADHRIGFFAAGEKALPERLLHLQHGLDRSRVVRSAMATRLLDERLPVAFLLADNHPTPGPVDLRVSPVQWNRIPKVPGDGRVPFSSALPAFMPPGIGRVYKTERVHHEMMGDPQIKSILYDLLLSRGTTS